MDVRDTLWCEKYRPHKIDDCILPDSVKKGFKKYVQDKDLSNNLLLCGTPGTGKTTIAKALCEELGCDWLLINGSEESGIDTLRTKIKSYASTVSLSGGRKIIIIDEADYMNANSLQPAMRGAIEEFSKNVSFIFTCNFKNRIMDAIQSRCSVIEFKLTGKEKAVMASRFLDRVKTILETENVPYDEKVLASFIMKYFPDYRKTLNELQRYANAGEIDEGILANLADVDVKELCQYLKNKDFVAVKKWVVGNNDNDPTRIYRRIYDGLSSLLDPQSIPQAIVILAKYQYQNAFASDVELNFLACLVELMVECSFK